MAEAQSITQAAKDTGASRTAMSESISLAEKELGFDLFRRGKGGAVLTDRGKEFLEYASRVVADMEMLEARYSGDRSKLVHLRVATQSYGLARFFVSQLRGKSKNAAFDFSLDVSHIANILSAVSSGERDMGFIFLMGDNEVPLRNFMETCKLSFHELFSLPECALFDRSHPLAQRESVNSMDLEEYPEFEFDPYLFVADSDDYEEVKVYAKNGLIRVPNRAARMEGYLESVARVNGYLRWCQMRADDIGNDRIAFVPIESDDRVSIGMVMRSDRRLDDLSLEYFEQLRAGCPLS